MRTRCAFQSCPCAGEGWTELKRNITYHECVFDKNKAHATLAAVLQCKSCRAKQNWIHTQWHGGNSKPNYQGLIVRVRTVATRPTVSGIWHTLLDKNGSLQVLVSSTNNGGQGGAVYIGKQEDGEEEEEAKFMLEPGKHKLVCELQQQVLVLSLTYETRGAVCCLDNMPIECFALQFKTKAEAVAANNEICSLFDDATSMQCADGVPAAITTQANLLDLLLDPTLEGLITQAELVLQRCNGEEEDAVAPPSFTRTIAFDRLCSKVEQVMERIVDKQCGGGGT